MYLFLTCFFNLISSHFFPLYSCLMIVSIHSAGNLSSFKNKHKTLLFLPLVPVQFTFFTTLCYHCFVVVYNARMVLDTLNHSNQTSKSTFYYICTCSVSFCCSNSYLEVILFIWHSADVMLQNIFKSGWIIVINPVHIFFVLKLVFMKRFQKKINYCFPLAISN